MHDMRLKNKTTGVGFVVIENVFNADFPLQEQYDLKVINISYTFYFSLSKKFVLQKGSTVDRLVEVEGEMNPSIALKDLNFKRKLHLGPQRKALLMEQVEKDTRVCYHPFFFPSS